MTTKKVTVLPYDKAWSAAFEEIRREVATALGDLVLEIEHVGSTAVEGMSAKPCIDLDVIIANYRVFAETVRRLEAIGYFHEGDLRIPEREAFHYEGKDHLMSHHLYVCSRHSRELHRHLTFRDFLRKHPDAAKQYSRVKKEAALLFPEDMEGYIAYKSDCIARLYEQCGLL